LIAPRSRRCAGRSTRVPERWCVMRDRFF
jgi:hypothetical protein